jgi:UDP-N-acetylmuramoyl-tripeptide--D-alanyl-D-alanine ligase
MKKYFAYFILEYFRFFARLQLRKNPHATIIGITGSAGKTSARLATVQILRTKGIVKHSSHANSQSGIPLNILGLSPTSYNSLDWLRLMLLAPYQLLTKREHFNYYVVEMGIDGPDYPQNMDYLLSIVRPHVVLILNASLTHTANFDYLVKDMSPTRRSQKLITAIAHEKMKLAHAIDSRGTVIVNLDQKELKAELKGVKARLITIGQAKSASLKISPNFTYHYQGQKYVLAQSDIFSPAYAYTFAGAIAVGATLGISPSQSIKALAHYRAPAGRLRLFNGIKGSTIIDSSYNASSLAVKEALSLLHDQGKRKHKIAVLGDMNELGLESKQSHKQLADWIMSSCDEAILFGPLTHAHTLPVLLSKKFPTRHFATMQLLTQYLTTKIKPSSLVLVKGSQNGILLERIVEALLLNNSDIPKLCRRGP